MTRAHQRMALCTLAASVVAGVCAAAAAPARAAPPDRVVVKRPTGCVAGKARRDLRVLYTCSGEERLSVDLGAHPQADEPLSPTRAPVVVPSELAFAWRVCPFAASPVLEADPDRFIAYEDRDVGPCYLYAPLDRTALARLGRYDPRDHLGTLHPYMKAVVLRALAAAAAAGDEFRVISGVRPGGKPSWHTFGLAVDVNLAHRKGLGEATRAFLAGGAESRAWRAFAATCEALGLYWLGKSDPDEIFHFEWRPGWTGLPHGELARDLTADVARAGPPAVWQRLRHDPSRKSAMKHLRDDEPVIP